MRLHARPIGWNNGRCTSDAYVSLLRTLLGLARADLTVEEISTIRAELRATAA
jgi:hypothetical protein